jgi:hypothetical protein
MKQYGVELHRFFIPGDWPGSLFHRNLPLRYAARVRLATLADKP